MTTTEHAQVKTIFRAWYERAAVLVHFVITVRLCFLIDVEMRHS